VQLVAVLQAVRPTFRTPLHRVNAFSQNPGLGSRPSQSHSCSFVYHPALSLPGSGACKCLATQGEGNPLRAAHPVGDAFTTTSSTPSPILLLLLKATGLKIITSLSSCLKIPKTILPGKMSGLSLTILLLPKSYNVTDKKVRYVIELQKGLPSNAIDFVRTDDLV